MIAKDPFPHLPTPFTIIVLLSSSHHLLPWTCVWCPSRLCYQCLNFAIATTIATDTAADTTAATTATRTTAIRLLLILTNTKKQYHRQTLYHGFLPCILYIYIYFTICFLCIWNTVSRILTQYSNFFMLQNTLNTYRTCALPKLLTSRSLAPFVISKDIMASNWRKLYTSRIQVGYK